MTKTTPRLGPIGVWRGLTDLSPELATQIESLGYGAIWVGGSPPGDLLGVEALLAATSQITVATGIVNIWKSDPAELAAAFHRVEERHPGRLLLGIGTGHREATPQRARPLDAMNRYLDVLDAHGVPAGHRVLSALGPKMLGIAAARSAGTHPYLTVPAQSALAREALGAAAVVAPEVTAVLDTDPVRSRASARTFLQHYLGMENYRNTWLRAGFDDADLAAGGSDRFVDTIVAQGDTAAVAAAVRAHHSAGADHVCLQVVPRESDVVAALAALAPALTA